MGNLEERKQRAAAAIERAYRVVSDLRTDLQKAAGGGGGEVPMRQIIASDTLQRAVGAAVEHALGGGGATVGAAADLCKVANEVAEAVSLATGERDQEKVAAMIEAALAEPFALDDRDAALPLAKAVLAAGPVATAHVSGLPSEAEERFASRAEQLAHLRKNTAGSPIATAAADAREERYSLQAAEAVRLLKSMKPTPIGHARPAFVDRRGALRAEIEDARKEGIHPSAVKHLTDALEFEHVRAATARPSGVMTWGGPVPASRGEIAS